MDIEEKTCIVDNEWCNEILASGYCRRHYQRWISGRDVYAPFKKTNSAKCVMDNDDCHYTHNKVTKGLCGFHYNRVRNGRDTGAPKAKRKIDENGNVMGCEFPGCWRKINARGLCYRHVAQFRAGERLRPIGHGRCLVPNCKQDVPRLSPSPLCKRHSKTAYNFTLEPSQLADLLGRECDNSGCHEPGTHIDHDHSCCPRDKFNRTKYSCGKCIRGVLCNKCNTALGMVDDSTQKMLGLVFYLRNNSLTQK